jgi:hypothetical protein
MTPAAPADLPGLLGPARLLARRYARRHRLDPDQCDSEACWALLAAYRCYDPERRGYEARGTTLRTWALGRVHFALRSLRRAALGTRRKRPVRVFATAHLAEHGAHDPPPAWAEDEAARHLLRGLTAPRAARALAPRRGRGDGRPGGARDGAGPLPGDAIDLRRGPVPALRGQGEVIS